MPESGTYADFTDDGTLTGSDSESDWEKDTYTYVAQAVLPIAANATELEVELVQVPEHLATDNPDGLWWWWIQRMMASSV